MKKILTIVLAAVLALSLGLTCAVAASDTAPAPASNAEPDVTAAPLSQVSSPACPGCGKAYRDGDCDGICDHCPKQDAGASNCPRQDMCSQQEDCPRVEECPKQELPGSQQNCVNRSDYTEPGQNCRKGTGGHNGHHKQNGNGNRRHCSK